MLPAVNYANEYDLTLGAGRVVSAFNAHRRTWVRRYAQPMVLSGCDVANPDAQMEPDIGGIGPEFTGEKPGWMKAKEAMQAKSRVERQKIVDLLQSAGKPLSRTQIAKRLSKPKHWVENNLPLTPGIIYVGRDGKRAKLFTVEE